MRSIANQTEAELGGPTSVLVRQRRDHGELDTLLHELAATSGEAEEELLTRLDRLVFSHAFAEETVLWPVLRSILPDGDELTLQVEKEHQEVCEIVSALERDGAAHPERRARLARLVHVLREDVRAEEDVLLPRLQEAVSVKELRRLGRRWAVTRRLAPTRPHASVSRRPPGNVLSGLPLTLLDRSRDAVDAGARRAPVGLARAARALSNGLASVAGMVERIPVMRAGDKAPTSR